MQDEDKTIFNNYLLSSYKYPYREHEKVLLPVFGKRCSLDNFINAMGMASNEILSLKMLLMWFINVV